MKPSRILVWGSLLGMLIMAVLACTRPQEPKEPKYVIAYNVFIPDSVAESNYEVFTMELDGSNKQNKTQHPDVAWVYTGADNAIYFISDRDTCYRCYYLFKMDPDGGNLKQFSTVRVQDSWMDFRNGYKELIVRPAEDEAFYILDSTGVVLERIPVLLPYFNDPAFSPDGKQIVFRGAEKPFKRDSGYLDELYIMNADGSNMRQLTQYPKEDTTAQWFNYHAGPPRWHPSGEFITYQSRQAGKSSLYSINPNGGSSTKLTELELMEGWHDWSPDGRWLAIEVFDQNQSQFSIALMDWQDKSWKILTDSAYRFQQAPVFISLPQ